ncbi:class I SAM-dependent methyltransferase [Crossiella sp. SN42]|uniref:class I SAM-dependent methyltransferase n=1 Tax=Crossiella sp. SN42 TaxID=2944808 RepID=UPI00207D4E36|nr:class I SAM-dependent methyltransferase [Crossiella sp. SN42]MCO1578947.1 class I SAM-dependent methyltransferase [Crossiella sp. SN42]
MTSTGSSPGFNHNDFYHRFLLRQVPPSCGRALDAGCGTGLFARRLAQRAHAVVGIDQDPAVIATARALSAGTPNIDYLQADLADCDLGEQSYDYICCIASIHHMPFAATVTRLREALAPDGVLAIVGCYRQATLADYLPDLIAIPANLAANAAVKAIARHRTRPVPQVNTAPVAQPRMTLAEIKREAQRLLPGAVIRRRLFWRYTLTYTHRPTTAR